MGTEDACNMERISEKFEKGDWDYPTMQIHTENFQCVIGKCKIMPRLKPSSRGVGMILHPQYTGHL